MYIAKALGIALVAALWIAPPGTTRAAETENLERIVGHAPDAGYTERLDRIHALPEHLSPEAIETLIAFLTDPTDPAPAEQADVYRNDAVNALRRSNAPPDEVAAALQRAWGDRRHSFVWRSYCLQHLGGYLPDLSEDRARSVRETLWRAASAPETECAGTALLALLSNLDHGIDAQRLADRALDLVADPESRRTAGLSAMQTLYELRDERAADLARELLTETRSVPLRLIALTTLGEHGGRGDAEYIDPYLNNPIPPLRRTAARARERFEQRHPVGDNDT